MSNQTNSRNFEFGQRKRINCSKVWKIVKIKIELFQVYSIFVLCLLFQNL